MKKIIAAALCLVLVLSTVGCGIKSAGNEASEKDVMKKAKEGDTTVKIDGVVYYNTKEAVPGEPDESVIVREELPLDGSPSGEVLTAYAFVSDDASGDTLVCLIDGEWYRFIETDRAK